MRLTKYAHACVRVEDDGVLVVDPGIFTDPEALAGADAVLVTHEHPDHIDVKALTAAIGGRPVPVYGPESLRPMLSGTDIEFTAVAPGDEWRAAGFDIKGFGGEHAVIHPDIPQITNVGYLIGGELYHPGDALFVPEGVSVGTLLAPVHAPWLKVWEGIDFVRAVAPERAIGIHDGLLTAAGLQFTNAHLDRLGGTDYSWVEPGTRIG